MLRAKTALSILSLPFRNGYVFLLCIVIIFLQAGFHAGSQHRDRTRAEAMLGSLPELQEELLSRATRTKVFNDHPIPRLMDEAEKRFRNKLAGQSKTLKAAVAEYRRRYKRPPPKGFDEWWKFATRHDVRLVDEYDSLMEDLKPFWSLSGVELRRRAAQAGELPFVDLVRIRKGESQSVSLHDSGASGRADGFRSMMERFVDKLPDMDFAINAMSHSRVLVPWEIQMYPNITVQDSSAGLNAMLGGNFQADWGNGESVWNAWRKTCRPLTPARRIYATLHSQNAGPVNYYDPQAVPSGDDFEFVANTSASHTDYCTKPLEYIGQGQFYSDWRTIHALYPIFSPAKARGFSDIRIPSHYYFGNTPRYTYGWDYVNLELKDVDAMEVPWEHKQDKVFWRGASTGGGNHPPLSAEKFQRQRFVKMASEVEGNRTVTVVGPSGLSTASVPLDKLNREVLDVALVKASLPGAYPGGLDAMLKELRFDDAVELGRHWGYKYLVDMDGVGYSARFMAFLASDSVPMKASVYNEFYEGWIEPWLHYIPLSSSYREVYNIHAYFSGPTQSTSERLGDVKALNADRRLRRLARAGKQWKKTMGRPVDLEAYVYRLCLEWARLVSDDRESMDY